MAPATYAKYLQKAGQVLELGECHWILAVRLVYLYAIATRSIECHRLPAWLTTQSYVRACNALHCDASAREATES